MRRAGRRMKLRRRGFVACDRAMFDRLLTDRETQWRLGRFLIVGGGTAAFQVAVLWGLKRWMNETLAFSLSWVASTAAHYVANRYWALPSARHDAGRQFGEYLFTVALSYVINLLAFKLCREWLEMSAEWAALWAIPPSTVVVFLMLNYRVFRARQR